MEAWQAVGLALAAVLVGALLPALVQLALALKAWRATAARTDRAVDAVAAAAERLERLTAGLEGSARLASALGATVGPAIGAAVRAWRDAGTDSGDGPHGANGAGTTPAWKEGES